MSYGTFNNPTCSGCDDCLGEYNNEVSRAVIAYFRTSWKVEWDTSTGIMKVDTGTQVYDMTIPLEVRR